MAYHYIYVFIGEKSFTPSGMFEQLEDAEKWIKKHNLSGGLRKLPLNISVYDWAIEKKYFEPKKEYQRKSRFIERFTCASVEHWHIEDGEWKD